MDSILVTGNGPLNGQIPIAGAKNACLTLMPATLLSDAPLTLTNAPRLSDIKTMSYYATRLKVSRLSLGTTFFKWWRISGGSIVSGLKQLFAPELPPKSIESLNGI